MSFLPANKTCNNCKTHYCHDLDKHFHKSTRDGYQPFCKTCKNNMSKEKYKEIKRLNQRNAEADRILNEVFAKVKEHYTNPQDPFEEAK